MLFKMVFSKVHAAIPLVKHSLNSIVIMLVVGNRLKLCFCLNYGAIN